MHYKDNFISQFFKIIGSFNFIGNPLGLMKNVAIGIFDIIYYPSERFIKGPIEGFAGIFLGI